MRTSKGKRQISNGDVCNHLSAFSPIKTANPIDTNSWVPMLAYRITSRLPLLDGGLGFIVGHLHDIGTHMALPVKCGGRFYLQFTGI